MSWPYLIIGLVALQRLAELVYAQRNTRALLAHGGREVGAGHYPLIVLLHLAWLVAVTLMLPRPPVIYWIPLILFILFQFGRVWAIMSLGPFWTTRIITLPDMPLVRRGPYRFVRHPNYMVVAGEIAALPLAFGEIWVAVIFTILNGAMIAWRIRAEDMALAPRRVLPANDG